MSYRCKFVIQYGPRCAKFSNYRDAMKFARDKSEEFLHLVEVHDKTGIVGQFLDGKATPEFADHWKQALKMV